MSIQSEITRISGNVSSALTAIAAKGVTVPSGSNSDDLATLITAIPSGGGGAANVVAGTITMGNTAGWQDVTVPYTGNGYPIAMMFWPDDGWADVQNTFYNKIDRYSNIFLQFVKNYPTSSPTYSGSGTENQFTYRGSTKSSSSDPTSTGSSSSGAANLLNPASGTPSSSSYNTVKMDSKTALHVYVHTNGSTTRGFSIGVKYGYAIVYSS